MSDCDLRSQAARLNVLSWDERAAAHGQDAIFYDADGVVSGAVDPLFALEQDLAGEVAGRRLLHLQCHIGLDSIGWARRGAHVTGVDFSPTAIAKARDLAERAGVDIEFVVADACALPGSLHGRFDLVVATYGIFSWIGDLDAWARNAASTLRPGGRLVVVDGHPLIQMIDRADPLTVDFPYADDGPHLSRSQTSYAAPDHLLTAGETVQWAHSVGQIVTALAGHLNIEEVREPLTCESDLRPGVLTSDAQGRWGLRIWEQPLPVLLAVTAIHPPTPAHQFRPRSR